MMSLTHAHYLVTRMWPKYRTQKSVQLGYDTGPLFKNQGVIMPPKLPSMIPVYSNA